MEKGLPNGWEEISVGEIATTLRGISYQKHEVESVSTEENCLVLRGGNIQNGVIIDASDNVYVPKRLIKDWQYLKKGDVVIVSSTGSVEVLGKAAPALKDCDNVSFGAFLTTLRPNKSVNSTYFDYYFQTLDYRNRMRKLGAGVNINNIKKQHLESLPIPLPPLPEQHRIVAKLDAVLAKVDSARGHMERLPGILQRFRQSVLALAVSGKLTEGWRKENLGVKPSFPMKNGFDSVWNNTQLPESWTWNYLGEVSDSILGKMLDKGKNIGEWTKYFGNINLRWFEFDLENLQEMRVTDKEKERLKLKNGDVMICEGGEPGRAAVWTLGDTDIVYQKAIHRVRPNEGLNPCWIVYNLKFNAGIGYLDALFTGTTIKHLTGRSLAIFPIPLPPLVEQQEIVRRVQSLFAVADRLEARYEALREKVEGLPQALLAKAFRGELVKSIMC